MIGLPSKTWFRNVMNKKYPHLKIHHPQQDKCNKCEELHILGEKDELLQHQIKAEKLREQMQVDFKDTCYVTFVLQSVQSLPMLRVNKALYNIGINVPASGMAVMNIWNEGTAKRGAREIGSCIFKFIMESYCDDDHIIMWIDSCTGQNKNFIMICI